MVFGLGKKKDSADEAMEGGRSGPIEPVGFPSPFFPSLDLVPQSRHTVLRRRKATRTAFVSITITFAAISALIVGLLTLFLAATAAQANAEARRDAAMAEYQVLQPVQELYDGFEERQTAVANALSSDVDYYTLITTLEAAVQDEIPLEALAEDEDGTRYVKSDYAGIGVVQYTVQDSPCPSDVPFDPGAALGCVQGTAVSSSYSTAGDVIAALNAADNGMFGGYILNVSDEDPVGSVGRVSWTFSINYGLGALSNKYASESEAILGNTAPTDDAAANPSASPTPAPITTNEDGE